MAGVRASWKGYLKLALLSCPIRLYKATGQAEKLSGHFLHKDTKNRISMIPYDPDLGRVDRRDLVTGYPCSGDRYVVLTDDDLSEITDPSDQTLTIESFVQASDVDPIYIDQPYFLAPDGDVAIEMLDVLKGAMAGRSRAAIARLVLHHRERLAALMPRGRGFLLMTLRTADEVRDPDAFFESLPSGDPSIELLNLAEQLVAMRSGRFDPHMFKDRYQAAVKALIEQKLAYGETADQPLPTRSSVGAKPANDDTLQPPTDLAEAFRQSLDGQRKPPAQSRAKTSSAKTSGRPKAKASGKNSLETR